MEEEKARTSGVAITASKKDKSRSPMPLESSSLVESKKEA